MSGLEGGAPLIVEDLSPIMKCVTFTFPKGMTRPQLERIKKNLRKRKISFTYTERCDPDGGFIFYRTTGHLFVGDKDLYLSLEGVL